MRRILALSIALLAPAPLADVAAYPLRSLYTTIELSNCTVLKRHKDGGAWRCKGLAGYPVFVAEGDLRTFVSLGKSAEKRKAARQTLRPFNSIFARKSKRATLEWRFTSPAGRTTPYAGILRYFIDTNGRHGEALVVLRITPAETCQVAVIDALATRNAIALARRLADTTARNFDCRKEPERHGARGAVPL
ncbi:MAG: hypothetical protein R3D68_05905 [Hyphomicrobiaceae bacterium]